MAARSELISTAELAEILGQPNQRVFDCTTRLEYLPPGSDAPYKVVPGRDTFDAGHVPGADFLGRHGVGVDSFVVLYSIATPMWATRFWWMLKSLGFDNVAVLDGGLDKWKAEGRALESGAAKDYPPAKFIAKPRGGFFVDR